LSVIGFMEIKKKSDAKNSDFLTIPVEGQNMYFKIRKANEQTVYLPTKINCRKFYTEIGDDGIVVNIKCISRTVKSGCKTCGLVNPRAKQNKRHKKMLRT